MKFFIAGIMQGSKTETSLHEQSYRVVLKDAIQETFPDSTVYDPLERNRDSLNYLPTTGRRVFMTHNKMCGSDVDALVAYLPEASMGTAIEMWEAWKNGAAILTISPMDANWVVKFLSDAVYPDLERFLEALRVGDVGSVIKKTNPRSRKRTPDDFTVMPSHSTPPRE